VTLDLDFKVIGN